MVDQPNSDIFLDFLKTKFVETYKSFLGTGPLSSSIYINSKFHCTDPKRNEEFISSQTLYSDLIDEQDAEGSGSNLIIGDSGLGKTSVALHVCATFWESRTGGEYNGRCPVYIHLPSVVENLGEKILDKCFTTEVRQHKRRLLLILDGYDELKDHSNNSNIFATNDWCYPDVKILVLSRNTIDHRDKVNIFQCLPKSNSGPPFVEYLIQPFENSQIDEYICKVDSFISQNSFEKLSDTPWGIVKYEYDEHGWNRDKYTEWMKRLPDLRDLAQTPLLLTLILQTLPVVVHRSASGTDRKVRKFSQTKVGIFDSFTENWFEFQYKRKRELNRIINEMAIFKTFCYAYAQNVALNLINRNPRLKNFGLLQENALVSEANEWKMLEIVESVYIPNKDKATLEYCLHLFKNSENSKILEEIQNACLIRSVQTKDSYFSFHFVHRSIAEYFVSRDIFVDLQGEFDYYLAEAEKQTLSNLLQDNCIRGLNKYILKEVAVQEHLAERVSSEPEFSDLLFMIIERSKELSLISIMSANAISILNIAGMSFSGRDFEWIQIPGANLNHSLCGNTNFKGANLENVSFEDSWLAGAKFNGANLNQTNFGLNSSFKTDEQCEALSIKFYQDWDSNKWFVYSHYYDFDSVTLKVIKWDLARVKKSLEFIIHDEKREDFYNNTGFCVIDKYMIMWSEKLCVFCAKTGNVIANVSIPEMPEMPFPILHSAYVMNIYEKKLFVARGTCIHKYEFYNQISDPTNFTLTLESEFHLNDDVVFYEFVTDLGVVVVLLEDMKFYLLQTGIYHTVQFFITSFAIDSRPNRYHIALGGYEGILQIRDLHTNLIIKNFQPKLPCAGIDILRYSNDFKYLGAGARDDENGHFIRIWETEGWTVLNSIALGLSKATDFQFWSSNVDEELILGVAFSDPQDGLQFYTVLLQTSRMITQQKQFRLYAEMVSCSVDGTLIASMLQKHRYASEDGPFLYGAHPREYMVHVWSAQTGRKMYGFEFEYDTESSLQQMHFVVGNNIICVERTNKGFEYFYVYDSSGSLVKSRVLINYRFNCKLNDDFSSTGYNVSHTGELLARGLTNGSVYLSRLLPTEPYLEFESHLDVPPEQTKKYYAAYFINFDYRGELLVSAVDSDSENNIKSAENCTVRIWNIKQKQLLVQLCQDHFRYPILYYSCKDSIRLLASSFANIAILDLTLEKAKVEVKTNDQLSIEFSPLILPVFDYHEELKFIALHAGPKLFQLWEIGQKAELRSALHLWFDIIILKFIPMLSTDDQCRILIVGQSNICCLAFRSFDNLLSLEWSHCSNLSLNVQDLCLQQCINLCIPDHKELLARGAFGSIAYIGQKYIAKSNIIVPILGSTLLEPTTIFIPIIQGRNEQLLNLSESYWIMSAIGNRSNARNPISRLVEKHVFLALEGIKCGRRFIFEAHLRYDKSEDKVFFQIFPTTDIVKFQQKYENCWVRQWKINSTNGMDLIADILSDYQNMLTYKFLTKNCIKWTKKKVKNRGFTFRKNLFDLIVVTPSALLGRQSRNSKNIENSS